MIKINSVSEKPNNESTLAKHCNGTKYPTKCVLFLEYLTFFKFKKIRRVGLKNCASCLPPQKINIVLVIENWCNRRSLLTFVGLNLFERCVVRKFKLVERSIFTHQFHLLFLLQFQWVIGECFLTNYFHSIGCSFTRVSSWFVWARREFLVGINGCQSHWVLCRRPCGSYRQKLVLLHTHLRAHKQ